MPIFWYYKSFGSAVRNLLFDAKVVQVLRFLAVELIYSFTWWAVKSVSTGWAWALPVHACHNGHFCGGGAGRMVPAVAAFFPVPHSAGSLWAYRLCVWLGRKDEQPFGIIENSSLSARRPVRAARFCDAPGYRCGKAARNASLAIGKKRPAAPVLWGKAFPCALNKVFEQGVVLQRFVVDAK